MADKLTKLLAKLPLKHLAIIEATISQIILGHTDGLDIRALKGKTDIYRVRVGEYRIIYSKSAGKDIRVILIAKRDERTYKNI